METRWGRAAGIFLVLLTAAVAVNLSVAALLHRAGLQTGFWDLHYWALFSIGHAPSWMPVDDSWMPMRKAWEWLRGPHQGTLYQAVFFNSHTKFQYPPSSLLVFAVPEALHIALTNRVLNWIGWLSVVIEAVATGAIVLVVSKGREWALREPAMRLAAAVAAGLAVFSFHSVLWAFSLGQIQTWLNAVFALAALAYLAGREGVSGALIGAICLVKPQFALFVLWAALRGKGRFLAGMAIVAGCGLALSLAWFGWANHLDYLSAISYMNRHGEVYYPNAAINGVMNRLLGNENPFSVDKNGFPPFHPLVYYTATLTSLAMIATALLLRRRRTTSADFLAAAVIFTVASPIAWVHHLGILPPVFAFLAAMLIEKPQRSAVIALTLAFLASTIFIPPIGNAMSGFASLIYALPLVGVLACVALLLCLRTNDPASGDARYSSGRA